MQYFGYESSKTMEEAAAKLETMNVGSNDGVQADKVRLRSRPSGLEGLFGRIGRTGSSTSGRCAGRAWGGEVGRRTATDATDFEHDYERIPTTTTRYPSHAMQVVDPELAAKREAKKAAKAAEKAEKEAKKAALKAGEDARRQMLLTQADPNDAL